MMVCVQGMRYEEASEELDIPVGTVRSRLSRARKQLQDLLDRSRTAITPWTIALHSRSRRTPRWKQGAHSPLKSRTCWKARRGCPQGARLFHVITK